MILPMENTEKMIFPGVGKYGIPEIKPKLTSALTSWNGSRSIMR